MRKFGYPDLEHPDFVFEALLGHGMFTDKLPPCFTSEGLLDYAKNNKFSDHFKNHAYIEYQAVSHTNIPRQFAIPHPETYWMLCNCIKDHWQAINEHIGQPEVKFSFCHVRKIKDKSNIFQMNYNGADKWSKEELIIDYSLGCKYVVSADISICFPNIYSHSIPWAIKGKEWSKKHRCNSWKKKNGKSCKYNDNQPCKIKNNELWPNDLDILSRSIKDGETNGLLIGPHTSNIISEIILTQVDVALQRADYKKVIRHIDDYEFFAVDEGEAQNFLRRLSLELKKYELSLNAKKTKIIPYQQFTSAHWTSQLNQFSFPDRDNIGFTTINSYIDYALNLSHQNSDYAVLNYAIKVISKKNLSKRAKRLYIKRVAQIALDHPYILPLLEKNVFIFTDGKFDFLNDFLRHLLRRSLQKGTTDSLAFVFYYGTKYKVTLKNVDWERVINLDDCISTLLAYKYCKNNKLKLELFHSRAKKIMTYPKRYQDKFWLFLYEVLEQNKLPDFLKQLNKAKVCFIKDLEDLDG